MTPETKRQMRKLLNDRLVELRAQRTEHLRLSGCSGDDNCPMCCDYFTRIKEVNQLMTMIELKPTTKTRVGVNPSN